MMTGLSLSFCIGDIVNGKVALDQVQEIIAGTAAEGPKAWEELLTQYHDSYWTWNTDDPDRCVEIARQLLAAGKIRQPRVQGADVHYIGDGHWRNEQGQKVRFR